MIGAALAAGWRPHPDVEAGVVLADMLNHGDPYGRFWTTGEPRTLAHPDHDGTLLNIAADAATTYLNAAR